MELRNHPGVHGKRDAYPFDPRMLKIDDQYNVRDLSTPEATEKLAELKESIRANGVKVPLEIRFTGGDVYIVSGHRRHRAVMELIEEGEPIETVLVISEPKGTNEADRVLNLVTSNSGEPLKPLEVAEVVRRLVAFGWEHQQIARRMGWKSASSVNQYLDMLAMPEAVKEHVRQGDVSATLARKIVKETGPEETPEDRIRANLEENKRINRGLKKVTPKSLKREAEKKKAEQRKLSPDIQLGYEPPSAASTLPVEQQPVAHVELPPASIPQQSPITNSEPEGLERDVGKPDTGASPVVASGDGRELLPHSANSDADLHQATLAKVEEHNGWHPDAELAAQSRPEPTQDEAFAKIRAIAEPIIAKYAKPLIDALEPFAALAEFNDLNARDDNDVIEVKVIDVKQAWRAYTQATGGQS